MPRGIKAAIELLKLTFEKCQKDDTGMMAAALSFYAVLSLAPALWVIMAVAGSLSGRESVHAEVVALIAGLTGPRAARFVSAVLDSLASNSSIATVVGLISMFFGATVAFSVLQDILNGIWHAAPRGRGYIKDFVVKRLISFGIVLLVGILLIASLLAGTAVSAVARFVPERLPTSELLLQTLNFLVSLAWMTVLFASIYRLLPDRVIQWRDVWMGAAVTSLMFAIGKTLITLYLGHASLASAYGTAGSLVIFLLWVYYSAQIFLFGAEFTEVYATKGCALPDLVKKEESA